MQLSIDNLSRILLALNIAAISGFVITPQQLALARSSPSFNCYRKTSGEYITRIHLPSGKKFVLINWGQISNVATRCSDASNKFQRFFDNGRLNYIESTEIKDGRSIVCGFAEKNGQCNNKSKIFELLPGDTIPKLLKRLGGSTPDDEGSNDKIVINFQMLLKKLEAQSE
jgi:hypothetical protein